MTKSLLITTLIIIILLMVCPVIITLVISKQGKEKELYKKIASSIAILNVIILVILLALWITPIKNKDFNVSKDAKTTTSTQEEETVTGDELSEAGFTGITINEYLDVINSDEKKILLVARPTCYYCQQFTPVLKQAKEDMNLTIYYINTDELSQDDWTTFEDGLEYLTTEEWGTPLTLIVQNGKTIDSNGGYVDLDTIKKFFTDNGFGE